MSNGWIEALEARKLLSSTRFPFIAGSSGFDSASRVAVDSDGGVIIAGLFSGSIALQPRSSTPTLTSAGDTDIFVAKYTPRGNLLWAHRFGGADGDLNDQDYDDLALLPSRAGPFENGVSLVPARGNEYVNGLAVDSSGSVYLVGSFFGEIDFDAGSGVQNRRARGDYPDGFLLKLDRDGNFAWVNHLQGQFTEVIRDVKIDPSGNPVIAGHFARRVDFNTGSGEFFIDSRGRADAFVAKYSGTDGAFIWASAFGSDASNLAEREAVNAIAIDGSGDIFATGTFARRADFDPTGGEFLLRSAGRTDAFFMKLNGADGTLAWANSIGGKEFDGGQDIVIGPGNTVIAVSYFERDADVDPGSGVTTFTATTDRAGRDARTTDLVVHRLNASDGSLVWARQLRGEGFETAGQLAVRGNSIFLTGGFYGKANFDPAGTFELTSQRGTRDFRDANIRSRRDSYDVFLWKLDDSGNFSGATKFGNAGDDFGAGLAFAGSNLLIVGRSVGTTNFRPSGPAVNRAAFGRADIFAALFDQDLNLVV